MNVLKLSVFSANTVSDGDKESECDELGPSPEDSRKVYLYFIIKYLKRDKYYLMFHVKHYSVFALNT